MKKETFENLAIEYLKLSRPEYEDKGYEASIRPYNDSLFSVIFKGTDFEISIRVPFNLQGLCELFNIPQIPEEVVSDIKNILTLYFSMEGESDLFDSDSLNDFYITHFRSISDYIYNSISLVLLDITYLTEEEAEVNSSILKTANSVYRSKNYGKLVSIYLETTANLDFGNVHIKPLTATHEVMHEGLGFKTECCFGISFDSYNFFYTIPYDVNQLRERIESEGYIGRWKDTGFLNKPITRDFLNSLYGWLEHYSLELYGTTLYWCLNRIKENKEAWDSLGKYMEKVMYDSSVDNYEEYLKYNTENLIVGMLRCYKR